MDTDTAIISCGGCYVALTCVVVTAVLLARYIRQSSMLDHFHHKHVLITGCDSGFGNLLAKKLDRMDFHVLAACLTEQGASELTSASSDKLKTVLLDVTDAESIRRAVTFVSDEVGDRGLWGLVNNAGRSLPVGPIDWLRLEDFSKVVDVNLMAVVGVTLQFLPLLKKARGRVVNVASILGRVAMVGGGYSISKFGVESFSNSLRLDMRHFGIKVSVIEPGFFTTAVTATDLLEENLKVLWDRLPQDVRDSYGTKYLERYVKYQTFSLKKMCSSDLSKVISCMEHALTARYPWTRYSAGWDAKLFWIPLSYCPTVVSDLACGLLYPSPQPV